MMIEAMATATSTREQQLTELYLKAFPAVAAMVSKQGGTLDEAKDIFQDALVILYERDLRNDRGTIQDKKAYLKGIARHLWYHYRQGQQRLVSMDQLTHDLAADVPEPVPSANRLLRYLEAAGKRCLDMLQAFYYDKASMREIAERFQLSGERSATVQKHKCLEKVREQVKERSLMYEDLCN
ncbi:sigma-70 family RNA polymerase sigma factor [Mucilaginibacter daejeonensis]|uniref:RNA polymerase sigma factor n=1 Tax=Mucilaginibacter daejeonensis TaxID=398049 RepID=UPI001D17330F|nr:sigma-70 family RNA polymerase sigma factor [Mucilaginibacter daejeonensis]UEG53603.1 sigma-70 family RNA polymerase sigma factor [Mucilaginibacter daejeonensis]